MEILQCTREGDDKPKFRLLREYKLAYGEQGMLEGVRAIMEIIKWFLAEAVKASSTADTTEPDPRT